MRQLIKYAQMWAVSGAVYRVGVVLALGAALVAGEGSISITWGGQ